MMIQFYTLASARAFGFKIVNTRVGGGYNMLRIADGEMAEAIVLPDILTSQGDTSHV